MATETLRPNAAGDECNINGETGCSACPNHYDCVDEVSSDGNTTQVQTNQTNWERDFYNIVNHSVGTGVISSITVYARCWCSKVPDQNNLKIAIKSGTGAGAPDTPDESTEKTLTTSEAAYSNQWATNPATAAAWTWDEIDALQIGLVIRKPHSVDGGRSRCTQVYVEVDYITIHDETGHEQVILAVVDKTDVQTMVETGKVQTILGVLIAADAQVMLETGKEQVIIAEQGESDYLTFPETGHEQVILAVDGEADLQAMVEAQEQVILAVIGKEEGRLSVSRRTTAQSRVLDAIREQNKVRVLDADIV